MLCPNDNNPKRIPRISHARRTIPNSTKQSLEKEHTQTNKLTRFGLNAYVLGAIRERFNCFGRRLQWLAASLNAREL